MRWVRSGLGRIWPKVRGVLLWQPLSRPFPGKRPTHKGKAVRVFWGIVTRTALLPLFLLGAWVLMIYSLSHPKSDSIRIFPEQFALVYEEVQFTSTDDVGLKGWYISSFDPANLIDERQWRKLRPAVVLCHSYGARRDQHLYPLAKTLAEHGYDVLTFDFRGHGSSDDAPVSFGAKEYKDVEAAVRYLRNRRGVDPGRIGIFGSGMGGYAAILAAPRCKGVKCVVAESAYPSIGTMFQRNAERMGAPLSLGTLLTWGMGVRFGSDVLDENAIDAARDFDGRGLLLLTGSSDRRTPAEDMEPVRAAIGRNASTMLVSQVGHGQTFNDPSTVRVLLGYFDVYLAGSAGPEAVASAAP